MKIKKLDKAEKVMFGLGVSTLVVLAVVFEAYGVSFVSVVLLVVIMGLE